MIKINKDILFKISILVTLSIALILGTIGTNNATEEIGKKDIGVVYDTHIQNKGWEEKFSKKDGELSGTQGESLRLEAIHIKLYGLSDNIGIQYQTHISNIGWQDWKENGQLSGTEGQGRRLEAIRIKLKDTEEYSVTYRVHVQNIGWQDWKTDGELAGTEGQSLRLEAIQIKIIKKQKKGILHLDMPISGSTYYKNTDIKVYGWKMANIANTTIKALVDDKEIDESLIKYSERQDVLDVITGYGTKEQNAKAGFEFSLDSLKLGSGEHIIKVFLMTKDNETLQGYLSKIFIDNNMHVQYSAHVQNIGWQNNKIDGETAGTVGQGKRIEAIKIEGINLPENLKIKYQAHVQNIGWQGWKNDNEIAGTVGQSKQVEAIKIKLEDTDKYSITYRTHVQGIGWQDWCYDGETAGTVGEEKRVEAIEIKIVPKIVNTKTQMHIDNPEDQVINQSGKISGWVMTTTKNTKLQISMDGKQIDVNNLKRLERQDVLNAIKGYGDEDECNKNAGFELNIDYSKYQLGKHTVQVDLLNDNNQIISSYAKEFTIREKINYSKGTYGITGLKAVGSPAGSDLEYYKWGNGPNVFYATFAIHGFEDQWNHDGLELIEIANEFYQTLINSKNYELAQKWTVYIFPGINIDGVIYGTTNDGPGRTTLVSQAPGGKGIDLNRCWQVGSSYTRRTDNRNYNGTTGFQAYEAQYLRNFLLNNKSKNGQTLLVDLHGWTQQLIGDPTMCSFYRNEFPENDGSSIGRYGDGYLVNWARNSLGSNGISAKAALIELPHYGVYNHQSVLNKRFSQRYINATLSMLTNM